NGSGFERSRQYGQPCRQVGARRCCNARRIAGTVITGRISPCMFLLVACRAAITLGMGMVGRRPTGPRGRKKARAATPILSRPIPNSHRATRPHNKDGTRRDLIQELATMNATPTFVGIDISKAHLD